MSAIKQKCFAYETFGDCRYGKDCFRSHDVWPYRTQTVVATILSKDSEVPGLITFLVESEDEAARRMKYYVSKGQWFSANAGTGDTVEILISEKKNYETGQCCARICRVITSASTPQRTSLTPSRSREKQDCHDFSTYKDCNRGLRCNRTHDRSVAYDQRFYVAEVLSVSSFGANSFEINVDVKDNHAGPTQNRRYCMPDRFTCNISEGSLVILQESERRCENSGIHFGKIMTVLHETLKLEKSDVPLERCVKSGFTLEPPVDHVSLKRKITTAYSMERCSDHDNCQRIGIHVRAASLGVHFKKLDEFFVPLHKTNMRNQVKGFDIDSIRFAITMYAHSASVAVEGPFITPLLIHSECAYTFCEASKYDGYLKYMWLTFGANTFINAVVNSVAASYMVDFPETWRERFLVRQMISFFNNEITKYLRVKGEHLVITKNISPENSGLEANDAVIPAENLEIVRSAWQLPSSNPSSSDKRKIALGFVLGSVKRSMEEFWKKELCDRYLFDVTSCSDLQANQSVITTSPIGQTVDSLNQRTVLSLMISPLMPALYSKSELLGLLVRRYDTPTIVKAVVRQLSKTFLYFQLRGVFGRRRGNRLVQLDQIFRSPHVDFKHSGLGDDSDYKPVESISLMIENLTSAEYCNCRLARLSGELVATLATTAIQQGVEASKTDSDIRDLIATHQVYDAPYRLVDQGTLVTLGRGVELQLQVTLQEDTDDTDHWLRLLRIGNGCHLCLAHLNNPSWAFFSGRDDVRKLISESSLNNMEDKIAGNNLKTVILKEIIIEWNDYYFSGGSFNTVIAVKPRSLLCIRREITEAEANSVFVWTCHAVVSKVSDNLVKFMVCSLFQDQTPDMSAESDNSHFIVEIIDTDEENFSHP